MSKISLTNLVNLQNETTAVNAINANSAVLTTALDNTLSRDGTTPNTMGANLDMNNNQILNLPSPSSTSSPARLIDVVSNPTIQVPPVGTSGATVPLLNANNTFSGTNTFGPVNFTTQLFWNNTQSTKLSNYTVTNGDFATTLILGGGVFSTLTLNAASTYSSNFFVYIENADTRGKLISPNGHTSFILWPNQSCLITNQNNNWFVSPEEQHWKLPSATTFYVDNINGSDSNDGLATVTGAFATIQHAMNTVSQYVDANGFTLTVRVSDGTYTENVTLMPVLGTLSVGAHNELILTGNTVTLGNTIWSPTSGTAVHVINTPGCPWRVQGFKFISTGSGGTAINCEFGASLYLGNNNYGSCTVAHIGAAYSSKIEFVDTVYSISGSAPYHIVVHNGSLVLAGGAGPMIVTLTGTPAFSSAFISSYNNSTAEMSGMTFSGSATGIRYSSLNGGGIDTSGGGATYFPGNSAGSSTTPGWYS